MADSIGAQSFVWMSMVPIGSKPTTDFEVRSGVNGTYFWLTGTRGQIHQVQTLVDVATIALAEDKMRAYEAIIGTVVTVIFASQTMPQSYFIHDVQPIPEECRKILLGVGGTLGSSLAICGALWTITAVHV